jgi:hypothetical protein
MPRRMPRFDNALSLQAVEAISIVGAGESAHVSSSPSIRKQWRIARLEALYELAYLRIFSTWEMYLEAVFYRSLCGYASVAGQEKLRRGSYYPDLASAEMAVLGGRMFLLWHNPQQVIDRCQAHIQSAGTNAGPCVQETVVASHLARLDHFSNMRHRIVHTHQADAKNKFDAATTHLVGRTYPASRPGKFLREYDTSKTPPRHWLDVISEELNALLAQMV